MNWEKKKLCAWVWALHHHPDTTGRCIYSRVLLCGQCHDKLSILSVTVAGSPSGTAGGAGGHRPRPSPSLHADVSAGQHVTELESLLIPSIKEKSSIKWCTVLKNQCLSWHHFMNGQGQFLGFSLVVQRDFSKWENDCELSVLLWFRGTRTVRDLRAAVRNLPIMYESASALYPCFHIS